ERLARMLAEQAKLHVFFGPSIALSQDNARIEDAIRCSRAFVVCVGPAGITDPLQQQEVRVALDIATIGRGMRIITVLLPDAETYAVPQSLLNYLVVDFSQSLTDSHAFGQLVRGISEIERDETGPVFHDRPPYKGMASYDEADARFYFGREAYISRA